MKHTFFSHILFFFSLALIGCKVTIHHDEKPPRVPECQMNFSYVNTYPDDSRYLQPVVTCTVKHARYDAMCQIEFQEYPSPIIKNYHSGSVDRHGNITLVVSTDPPDLRVPANCDFWNPLPRMKWRAECIVDGALLNALDTRDYTFCGGTPFQE